MSIGTRIKEIRKSNGLTQVEFGNKVGLTKSAVSKVEKDIHGISDGVFLNIINEFCLNEEWLMNGTGNQYNTDLQNKKMITQNEILFMSDTLANTVSSLSGLFAKYSEDKRIEMITILEQICRLFNVSGFDETTYLKYLENISSFLLEINRYIEFINSDTRHDTTTITKYLNTFHSDLIDISSFFVDTKLLSNASNCTNTINNLSADEEALINNFRNLTPINQAKVCERTETLLSEQSKTSCEKAQSSSNSQTSGEEAITIETA